MAAKELTLGGQMTIIYQTSSISEHTSGAATFSGDLFISRELEQGSIFLDLQYARGAGVDAAQFGGAMVNNDVMQDPEHPEQPYLAKLFYERKFSLKKEHDLTLHIGKFGVNDYFDLSPYADDQTILFLNQAINNSGAFDYAQDLKGHGYTYGWHAEYQYKEWSIDLGHFSANGDLDQINNQFSLLYGLKWRPKGKGELPDLFQVFAFINKGEYGSFDHQGDFLTSDKERINTKENKDRNDKKGVIVNLNYSLSRQVHLFAKFGQQDDNRDVRHYQDMDRSTVIGLLIDAPFKRRPLDALGFALERGELTGNHRKAHERGYQSFFNRSSGIGSGNYKPETVAECFYRYQWDPHFQISLDYQWIHHFNYDRNRADAHFVGSRLHLDF
tara:strand:+ start:961 stop:2118 length:1158 start_codon:yes stop_codon:yes gene_type:complete